MEKVGGGEDPATREAGGMCDRFLTFLAKNLTMSRMKTISDGPKNNGGAAQLPAEVGEEDGEEDDEFAIPIERAEFDDFEFAGGHGDGGSSYGSVPTILGESTAAATTTTTTTTRDVPDADEPKTGASAAAADDAGPVAAEPAPAAAVEEETKVRKSVTIKEDRPEQEGGGASAKTTVERKRSSLFKKRQASSSAAGDEQQRAPRRSGLRPRMPPALRVPSNINERSSTFIEERWKSFGRGGKPAPDK